MSISLNCLITSVTGAHTITEGVPGIRCQSPASSESKPRCKTHGPIDPSGQLTGKTKITNAASECQVIVKKALLEGGRGCVGRKSRLKL